MGKRPILARLRRALRPVGRAGREPLCHWCGQPILGGDEVVLLDGERYHTHCAFERLTQRS